METKPTQNKIYRDLYLNFTAHPNTKKLVTLTEDTAIVRALKNLLFTNHYERPFHPEIGTNLRAMLFENILPATARTIKSIIVEAIENFEPRVRLVEVFVSAVPDENRYEVQLEYFILNETLPQRVTFFLERIR